MYALKIADDDPTNRLSDVGFDYKPALIAWSPDHDGHRELKREMTFHAAENEANPAFIRHRISWRDDIGCLHWVRYEELVEPSNKSYDNAVDGDTLEL